MTQISKGEGPRDLPPGAVGKSSGFDPGRPSGPATGAGTSTSAGTGTGTGPASGPGAGAADAGVREPRRVDLPADGFWAGPLAPAPEPDPVVAAVAARLGGTFDDIVYTGRGAARFAMAETPPPGYVLVEFARTGGGFFSLDSIDWDGREAVVLGGSDTSRRWERRAMWCDNLYPLRFRVGCDARDEWVIVVRSVRAVRPLGTAAAGRGSEVLLHTGPAAELVSRTDPAPGGRLRVEGFGPRRPGAPAPSTDVLASTFGRPSEDARALREGPLLVAVVEAAGDWSLEVQEPRPRPEPPRGGLWSRLFGRRG